MTWEGRNVIFLLEIFNFNLGNQVSVRECSGMTVYKKCVSDWSGLDVSFYPYRQLGSQDCLSPLRLEIPIIAVCCNVF